MTKKKRSKSAESKAAKKRSRQPNSSPRNQRPARKHVTKADRLAELRAWWCRHGGTSDDCLAHTCAFILDPPESSVQAPNLSIERASSHVRSVRPLDKLKRLEIDQCIAMLEGGRTEMQVRAERWRHPTLEQELAPIRALILDVDGLGDFHPLYERDIDARDAREEAIAPTVSELTLRYLVHQTIIHRRAATHLDPREYDSDSILPLAPAPCLGRFADQTRRGRYLRLLRKIEAGILSDMLPARDETPTRAASMAERLSERQPTLILRALEAMDRNVAMTWKEVAGAIDCSQPYMRRLGVKLLLTPGYVEKCPELGHYKKRITPRGRDFLDKLRA